MEFPVSLTGLSRALRAGEVSPVEVTEGMLDRIGADRTNAFITVTAERALGGARRAGAGSRGGFAGRGDGGEPRQDRGRPVQRVYNGARGAGEGGRPKGGGGDLGRPVPRPAARGTRRNKGPRLYGGRQDDHGL